MRETTWTSWYVPLRKAHYFSDSLVEKCIKSVWSWENMAEYVRSVWSWENTITLIRRTLPVPDLSSGCPVDRAAWSHPTIPCLHSCQSGWHCPHMLSFLRLQITLNSCLCLKEEFFEVDERAIFLLKMGEKILYKWRISQCVSSANSNPTSLLYLRGLTFMRFLLSR